MKTTRSNPTMKDVAQEAGVSLGTVSNVFNNMPVGDEYRQRVEEAAERLGYRINQYARGLRAGKTNTVALILPSLDHPYFALLANCICSALNRRDYRMVVNTTQLDPMVEAHCIQMVKQNKVDGIIGLTYAADLEIDDDFPYVSIDRFIRPSIPCVASDNFSGGSLAAEKLVELGCKRLLFLRIGSNVCGEADKRGAGFSSYCIMHGIDMDTRLFNDEDGIEAVDAYLDRHFTVGSLDFDGIFCNTDKLAVHVVRKLQSLRVHVPEDVQVIGFDGLRTFINEGDLHCSTIVQPAQQIAETAVYVLLDEHRVQMPGLICLPVTYEAGGTTRE